MGKRIRLLVFSGILGFFILFCIIAIYWVVKHNNELNTLETEFFQIKHPANSSKVLYDAIVDSGPGSGTICCYNVGEIRKSKLSQDEIKDFYDSQFKDISQNKSFYTEILFYNSHGKLIDGESLPEIFQKLPCKYDIGYVYYLIYFNGTGKEVGYDIRLLLK